MKGLKHHYFNVSLKSRTLNVGYDLDIYGKVYILDFVARLSVGQDVHIVVYRHQFVIIILAMKRLISWCFLAWCSWT